jgi:cell division protein FtsW
MTAYNDTPLRRNRNTPREAIPTVETTRPEVKIGFWASLDKPLLLLVGVLLAIGAIMVYSTTFYWSPEKFNDHLRNLAFGSAGLVFFALVDYRFWKRFAPWLLLITVTVLVAVLIFGDNTFGARRSLIAGRFQPGELATLTTVMYLAAWLSAKNARPDSFLGMISFGILVVIITVPVVLQPDLSSAVIIGLTALLMFFLAGAQIWYLMIAMIAASVMGFAFVQITPYAQDRVTSYISGLADPTQANYHTQQAIIAFVKGGWLGRGLGQSEQKIESLPAPHTDSIFAVIGEEMGVVGATIVVFLFVAYIIRGFMIARRAVDPFGSLLVVGFTSWVAIQSLLNIAVMTAVIPSSGLPLPFISYGGSALLVLMVGVGLILSVARVSAQRQASASRRKHGTDNDRGWGNGRSRLSSTSRRGSTVSARNTPL